MCAMNITSSPRLISDPQVGDVITFSSEQIKTLNLNRALMAETTPNDKFVVERTETITRGPRNVQYDESISTGGFVFARRLSTEGKYDEIQPSVSFYTWGDFRPALGSLTRVGQMVQRIDFQEASFLPTLGERLQAETLSQYSGVIIEDKDVGARLLAGDTVLRVTHPWAKDIAPQYFAFPSEIDAAKVGFELVCGHKALPDVTALSLSSKQVVVSPINGAANIS